MKKGRNAPLLIRKECRRQSPWEVDCFVLAVAVVAVDSVVVVGPILLAFAADIVAGFPRAD